MVLVSRLKPTRKPFACIVSTYTDLNVGLSTTRASVLSGVAFRPRFCHSATVNVNHHTADTATATIQAGSKHTPNAGKGLDEIAPEGDYVLLNGWMAIPKAEALDAVTAAKQKGDEGVYAVPLAQAIAAPALLEALRNLLETVERIGAPGIQIGTLCEESDWACDTKAARAAIALALASGGGK